ncbi:hypothetical protein OUZ56_010153 [Daphnia magna]|uniref:Uncharacterized protein n=1 Tax=Daphnia magna TaxID=35525 RepID=A0ABR0AID3_9CRUS|nr:hypothetical protein OUZ56_010153 [Daphnia magna]
MLQANVIRHSTSLWAAPTLFHFRESTAPSIGCMAKVIYDLRAHFGVNRKMTHMRTVYLLLSQYVSNGIDELSSEEDDSEFEDEGILTLIGTYGIERHPRHVGILEIKDL